MTLLLGTLMLTAQAISPRPPSSHDEEISMFASTMAIVWTVGETCPGSGANESYLKDLGQWLHVVEAEHDVFAQRARSVVAILKSGLAKAPSPEAWCKDLFALYGPNGRMIPGLLRRRDPGT